MRKYSLDKTWRLCIEMWEWIVAKWKKDKGLSISVLKKEWLDMKGIEDIESDCFFCEYDKYFYDNCDSCPGRLVSRQFNCGNSSYRYSRKPDKFLAKIKALNKKRLAK